jgi:hypothetical protein
MANFVTSTYGKQNIVRSKAFNRRDAKTEAQVKQRGGFKMIGELYPMLGSIPEEGFTQRASNTSVYTAFMAANLVEAIDKSGVTAQVDYTKLKVADGTMPMPVVKAATLDATGVAITYLPMLKNQMNFPTDEMVALALLKTGELWIERQPRGEEIDTDTLLIPVTDVTADDIQAIYLFAKRTDGTKVSKSVYVTLGS